MRVFAYPLSSFLTVPAITRASQILAEILVVGITWCYTYQSYRIKRSVKFGRTTSSLLFYNGESSRKSLLDG